MNASKHKVFYFCLVAGFTAFFTGLVIIPGWWKILWVAGCFALVMFMPILLERVLDPINIKLIQKYCLEAGASDIQVTPYPNHYGVRFRKNNSKHYSKCTISGVKISWIGKSPHNS